MKTIKLGLYACSAALIVWSCGSVDEHSNPLESEHVTEKKITITETTTTTTTTVIEESPTESRYHYDEDWERFKTALINKDIPGVSAFASSDAIDAEMIVNAFTDSNFLKQLEAATYTDLVANTKGEEVILEFSASFSISDEEGNEYESALFLYFSQGETGLLLENFLAAG
ncbi:MAG: hypothetical protein JKY54_10910 [Flavobacteriales bacterium]|nr:hypothetical protein [Flavobacteriales bacterium]